MSMQERRETQEGSAREGIMVVSQDGDGFRVFAATDPSKVYQVGGGPDAPVCNCADFQWRRAQPGYRCGHIQAVFRELDGGAPVQALSHAQEPVASPEMMSAAGAGNGVDVMPASQMTLKRSVSPDGRIDSLSVEFAQDLTGLSSESALEEAANVIALQGRIVAGFLGTPGNGNGHGPTEGPQPVADERTVPAQLGDIGGMQTRWGWRYFINVRVNGDTVRLFGNRKQLGEYITAAGYPGRGDNLTKGVALNLPCRVIIRPSNDGKYMNVEQVLPAQLPANYQGRGH